MYIMNIPVLETMKCLTHPSQSTQNGNNIYIFDT